MSDIDESSSSSAYMSAKDAEEDGISDTGTVELENRVDAEHPDSSHQLTSSNSSSPTGEDQNQKTPPASIAGESPPPKPNTPSLVSNLITAPPAPRYFAARDDGTLTPLIAVDELPSYVQIQGVPRTLTAADTVGMISLGTVARGNGCYVLHLVDTSSHASHLEGLSNNSIKPFASASEASELASNVDGSAASFVPRRIKEWVKGQSSGDGKDRQGAVDTASKPKTHLPQRPGGMSYNPTTPGVFGGKIYCTHWVRTGECDFTQQGCIFRHEMPEETMLAQMGFRTIPRWFREAGGYSQTPLASIKPPPPRNEEWRPQPPIAPPAPFMNNPFGNAPQHGGFNNIQPPRQFPPPFPPARPLNVNPPLSRGLPPPRQVNLGNPSFNQPRPMNENIWPGFGHNHPNLNNNMSGPPALVDPRTRGFPVPPGWKPTPHLPQPHSGSNRPSPFNNHANHFSPASSQHRVQTEPDTTSSASTSSPQIPPSPLVTLSPRAPSAVSGITNRSAMTMSAFVPQEPKIRAGYTIVNNNHRSKNNRITAYKPLAPAAPTTHPLPAKPGFIGQGKTGNLFDAAPDTPAPVHKRMFVPPPPPAGSPVAGPSKEPAKVNVNIPAPKAGPSSAAVGGGFVVVNAEGSRGNGEMKKKEGGSGSGAGAGGVDKKGKGKEKEVVEGNGNGAGAGAGVDKKGKGKEKEVVGGGDA